MKDTAYFISDAHLGIPLKGCERREEYLVRFLHGISDKASHLFILGDLFDFWIEYKHAIRPDYFSILHALKRLIDKDITVYYLAGNHDFALGPFFKQTLGITVSMNTIDITLQGKNIHLRHGDGILKSEIGYRFWRSVLRNPLNQKIYKMLHPAVGIRIAGFFSKASRRLHLKKYSDVRKMAYIKEATAYIQKGADIVIMGHTHFPEIHTLEGKIYCNIGDWLTNFTYGKLENGAFSLLQYRQDQSPVGVKPLLAK